MSDNNSKLFFASDYMEGAHENIIQRLAATNLMKTPGYGTDEITLSAKSKIKKACGLCGPDEEKSDVYFLVGGTQTNATVIDALLRTYQGVISVDTGHVTCHEAGAIEAGGHKVLPVKGVDAKLRACDVENYINNFFLDDNCDHMVQPGMVYISQPTEYGTLYSKKELADLSEVCHKFNIPLYVDGARLAYALASKDNDVELTDLAKYCDAFYIGGTKCGSLFGEAVVFPDKKIVSHFFTTIKQHGALFAKGRLLGIQFDELFTNDLYFKIGDNAINAAVKIRAFLKEHNYKEYLVNPTNQIFVLFDDETYKRLSEKIEFGFWEKPDATHTVARIATSWATSDEDINKLFELMK